MTEIGDLKERVAAVETKVGDLDEDMKSLRSVFEKFRDEDIRPILNWVEQQKGAATVKRWLRDAVAALAGTGLGVWLTKLFGG